MSDSTLVPERQLVFSPGLAATVGLEEAILMQHLHSLTELQTPRLSEGVAWLAVEWDYLRRTLPFWDAVDLRRIADNLQQQGVLLLETFARQGNQHLIFAFNELGDSRAPASHASEHPTSPAPFAAPPSATTAAPLTTAAASNPKWQAGQVPGGAASGPTQNRPDQPVPRGGATPLPARWAPSEALLQLLALSQNIPRQFALDQLEDFIFYWRERGEASHAWENKFRQHVTSSWRRHQQHQAEAFREPVAPLDNSWRPSADAMEILARDEINTAFIEQAIPEFILYWRERGTPPRELNSKFLQHIRIQWARYTSSVEHSTEPQRITENWQPSEDVFDILRMSHIDAEFARSVIPEFIVYWRDSNQAHTSWNSKFLQHVKYHWAKRHQIADTGHSHGGQQGTDSTGRTRDRSLQDDLTDTSWAD